MQTYAASRWQILIKLRIPNALPQIFTALKISATASVVGAIIGELPSGIQDGLGIAILNFSRFYNQSPPRLFATIVASGLLGILFFAAIALDRAAGGALAGGRKQLIGVKVVKSEVDRSMLR